jgi:hypothetical protein
MVVEIIFYTIMIVAFVGCIIVIHFVKRNNERGTGNMK